MIKPQYIILHHSLTKDGHTVSWGAIRRYHMVDMGWRDIGYHYGIEDVDGHMEILMGRLPGETGAHCPGMNQRSIGICCVGNFDAAPPPDDQWQLCLNLTRALMALHEIPADRVLGHREAMERRTCPGRFWDLKLFRSMLLEFRNGGAI